MAPNERARKNHETLFPNHVSTLAVTDPELIESFDNFAFDEVLRESALDVHDRLMLQLAALVACLAQREYRVMLGAALNIGVTPSKPRRAFPVGPLLRRPLHPQRHWHTDARALDVQSAGRARRLRCAGQGVASPLPSGAFS